MKKLNLRNPSTSISISTSTSHIILSLSKDHPHRHPTVIPDSIRNPMNQRTKYLPQANPKVYILSSKIYIPFQTIIPSGIEKSFNFNFNFPRNPEPVEGPLPTVIPNSIRNPMNQRTKYLPQANPKVYILRSKI